MRDCGRRRQARSLCHSDFLRTDFETTRGADRMRNSISIALGIAIAAAISASALAHDMGAMGTGTAPNAMGAHLHMSEHMKMTDPRAQSAADADRADALLAKLRQ